MFLNENCGCVEIGLHQVDALFYLFFCINYNQHIIAFSNLTWKCWIYDSSAEMVPDLLTLWAVVLPKNFTVM